MTYSFEHAVMTTVPGMFAPEEQPMNSGAAIWLADTENENDTGILVEAPDRASMVAALRKLADQFEAMQEQTMRAVCRWCREELRGGVRNCEVYTFWHVPGPDADLEEFGDGLECADGAHEAQPITRLVHWRKAVGKLCEITANVGPYYGVAHDVDGNAGRVVVEHASVTPETSTGSLHMVVPAEEVETVYDLGNLKVTVVDGRVTDIRWDRNMVIEMSDRMHEAAPPRRDMDALIGTLEYLRGTRKA